MADSSTKLKGLIECLRKEVYNVENDEKELKDLKERNEKLRIDLGVALETIIKLETKQIELEQENLHLKTQKQKLKLAVVKLKRKRESDRTKMQSNKRTKTMAQSSSTKVIDLSLDTSNEAILAGDFQESTSTCNNKLPVATIDIDSTRCLLSNSTAKRSPRSSDASDRIKNILEQQTTLNPRKKTDRSKMEAKPCEHCKQWYGESWEHMKDTCRHRYNAIPPSTPENFWNVNYPQKQDDS